jgi:hypothetical protein
MGNPGAFAGNRQDAQPLPDNSTYGGAPGWETAMRPASAESVRRCRRPFPNFRSRASTTSFFRFGAVDDGTPPRFRPKSASQDEPPVCLANEYFVRNRLNNSPIEAGDSVSILSNNSWHSSSSTSKRSTYSSRARPSALALSEICCSTAGGREICIYPDIQPQIAAG